MKGYKGFEKGLVCRDKQYAENTIFEEAKAEVCSSGMHFCKNPLDILDYYPLFDKKGDMTEFAEVEALAECKTNDNKKYCTTKLKIGAKLDLKEFINVSVSFLLEKTKNNVSSEKDARLVSSGEYARLVSSGGNSRLVSSGNDALLVSSGYGARLVSSGEYARLVGSGDGSQLLSSGYGARLVSSGEYARLVGSGYGAQLVSSGGNSRLVSSGGNSRLVSSGGNSRLVSSGGNSRLVSSGEDAKLAVTGKNAVCANIGINGTIKGVKGTWITLAEYDNNNICLCVKSAQIDGVTLKENTFYELKNGEFKEAEK